MNPLKRAATARNDVNQMTTCERAILEEIRRIESLGASPILTEAVVKLSEAQSAIADHFDGKEQLTICELAPPDPIFAFALKSTVRDTLLDVSGIVTCRCDYLTSESSYLIEWNDDKGECHSKWVDESRLEALNKEVAA